MTVDRQTAGLKQQFKQEANNLPYQYHGGVTSVPLLQQNLSVRRIRRTPGPDSLLSSPGLRWSSM